MERPLAGRKLLTVEQVAAQVQVQPETVRRWLREGRLKGVRLGGTKLGYRISEADLEQFIRQGYTAQGKAAA